MAGRQDGDEMATLSDTYRGTEEVQTADMMYILYVEITLLADIFLCLQCIRQWRRLRDHVMLLTCLGVGDFYLIVKSLWMGINRVIVGDKVSVCSTWSAQHNSMLTELPLVDLAGFILLIGLVLHKRLRITRSYVASVLVASVPWVLSLVVVIALSMTLGIDACICENFTYDRYMGFNASKFVYQLSIIVPIVSSIVIFLTVFYTQKASRQYQSRKQIMLESPEKHLKIPELKSLKTSDTTSIKTPSLCHNDIDIKSIAELNHGGDINENLTDQDDTTLLELQYQGPSPSPDDDPSVVSAAATVAVVSYLFLVVFIPMLIANVASVVAPLEEAFSVDVLKLTKDLYLWIFYLRTSCTTILWIAYMNL